MAFSFIYKVAKTVIIKRNRTYGKTFLALKLKERPLNSFRKAHITTKTILKTEPKLTLLWPIEIWLGFRKS